jgi:hypothetical protein
VRAGSRRRECRASGHGWHSRPRLLRRRRESREERELGWGAREEEAGGWGGEGGRGLKKFVWVMKERYEGIKMRE